MIKVKYVLFVSLLSGAMLMGCGKSETKVSEDSDNCVVVQVPENTTIEELFDFTEESQIALSNWGDDYGDATSYKIGKLKDGGSIVWGAGNVFLYVPGEAKETSIVHYKNRLQDTPISYENFKDQSNNE